MVRKFQDLVVSGISTNILSDKVVITWNIAGLNEFEKPLYVVSIWSDENGVRLLKQVNTTETMHELGIARRPWKFQLEVLPVIGEYVGIASDNVTIDLEEMGPLMLSSSNTLHYRLRLVSLEGSGTKWEEKYDHPTEFRTSDRDSIACLGMYHLMSGDRC
ncbi:hypothetical protein Y032_0075g919 [Ancylostoma ceylanicum]|uniref:Fibronectin type-III domain-containing protein n=1 Tax=Ancylostoma ceylanicum TaxID=53326 RepID=A0A016TVU1_9BILA|nr:hypothetical protein Y032_0075g919 [Ancylostoma ceylanicum]